jgi:PAS domain-containing protein
MSLNFNEIHLARQLANSLVIPIFIVDPDGALLFYNEPAEQLLGRTFSESGEMPASVWSRLFIPTDRDGVPLEPDTLPLMIALNEKRAAHKEMWIRSLDNTLRHIEVTAFPLLGQTDRFVGAVAMFWDVKNPEINNS